MRADDIWGDDDDEGAPDGQKGLDREWQTRREEHFSSGYREGLEAGKHETVQEGFDAGYADGAAAGFACGQARGAAATLHALAPRLPQLAARLQETVQQQQQQGGAGQQRLVEDIPYQQLQRQVCESLMAASTGAEQHVPATGQAAPTSAAASPPLPPDVAAALHTSRARLDGLGLGLQTQ